ncbi:uncharacterized protein LOC9635757 [Selaginella moellendorffii]|nr:uncharacterized protein LOC9635757 [Selaginella moellendorffii]|eukprot:XP_002967442.2 uncharacterized protein LOC9635757 [Selaginella moellendorffii]
MEGFGAHAAGGSSGTFGSSDSSDRHRRDDWSGAYDPYRHSSYDRDRIADHRQSGTQRGSPSACCWLPPVFILATVLSLFGLHPPLEIEAGLGYSRLIDTNPLFVREIQVRRFQGTGEPVVYSFHHRPALEDVLEWSHDYDQGLHAQSHQEWALWLNKGSVMTIKYNVMEPDSDLIFAIFQGKENFLTWVADPLHPTSSVFRQKVKGSGVFEYFIEEDGDYYFAFGNMNDYYIEVALRLEAQLKAYSTKNHDSRCSLKSDVCKIKLPLFQSTSILLTTSEHDGLQHMRVKYKARWATFVVGFGALVAVLVLLVKKNPCKKADKRQEEKTKPEDASPLIDEKLSNEQPSVDHRHGEGSHSSPGDEQLCAICLDAPKDSFFDPCGHCATCYACGERIKASGNAICPICRENIRTVRRLFVS